MKVGICNSLSNVAAVKAAGADFIEENVQRFLKPEAPDQDFELNLAAASGAPLPVIGANSFLPGALKCVGPDVEEERILRYAQVAMKRAGACGIEALVFGSGASRKVPDGYSRDEAMKQFIDICKKIAPLAQAAGVVLVIEPLNSGETNLINSLAEGAHVVNEVAHSSVQLLADIFHMLRDDEDPKEIVTYGALLKHAHVAEKEDRTAPGVRGDDLAPYFEAFKEAGYPGPISIECRWGDFASEAPAAVELVRALSS